MSLRGVSHQRLGLALLGGLGTAAGLYLIYRAVSRKPAASADAAASSKVLADFLHACKRGDLTRVDSLLAANPGIDLNAKDKDGLTALIAAAACGQPVIVSYLLSAGADATRPDGKGLLAVHHAASMGHLEVLRTLVKHAAGPSPSAEAFAAAVGATRAADGATPLMLASSEGHVDAVQWLLDARADVDAAMKRLGVTALHAAAQKDRARVVRMLLERGANKEAQASDGRTPLAVAAMHGAGSAVGALLEAGANVNGSYDVASAPAGAAAGVAESSSVSARDPLVTCPLAAASRKGHTGIIRSLIAAGASPDAVRMPDGAPLLLACVDGFPAKDNRRLIRPDVIAALLLGGADPELAWTDGDGDSITALEAGLDSDDRAVVRVFTAWEAGTLREGGHQEGDADVEEDPAQASATGSDA